MAAWIMAELTWQSSDKPCALRPLSSNHCAAADCQQNNRRLTWDKVRSEGQDMQATLTAAKASHRSHHAEDSEMLLPDAAMCFVVNVKCQMLLQELQSSSKREIRTLHSTIIQLEGTGGRQRRARTQPSPWQERTWHQSTACKQGPLLHRTQPSSHPSRSQPVPLRWQSLSRCRPAPATAAPLPKPSASNTEPAATVHALPPAHQQNAHSGRSSGPYQSAHEPADSFEADDVDALEVHPDGHSSHQKPSLSQDRPGQTEAVPESPEGAPVALQPGADVLQARHTQQAQNGTKPDQSASQAAATRGTQPMSNALADIFSCFGDLANDGSCSSDDEHVRMELGSSDPEGEAAHAACMHTGCAQQPGLSPPCYAERDAPLNKRQKTS